MSTVGQHTPQWWVYLAMDGGPGDLPALAVLIAFGALTAASAIAIGRDANGRNGIVMLSLNAAALGVVIAGFAAALVLASLTSLGPVAAFVALGLLLLAGAFAWKRIRET